MDFDPNVYDKTNTDTLLPTKRLIEVINGLKSEKRIFSTIVDIGCGSGNMTKLLSEEIECRLVIGLDIDNKMIEFAKSVNQKPNIEYLIQDIQQNWQQLNPRLRTLEGKVSVVTSNFSLTWVKDIRTAADNIGRLVSDDGVVVINIVYDGDIYERLDVNQRSVAEQYLKYPTEEEMIGKWINALKRSGFGQMDVQYWEPKATFVETDYHNDYLNIPINWYKSYAKDLKNGHNIEMTDLLRRLLIEDRCMRLGGKTSDGKDLIQVTNYIWQIVAFK